MHSSFAVIFPLHCLYLVAVHKYPAASLWRSISAAIADHLAPTSEAGQFPHAHFLRLALACTVGVTLPALLWFAAVSLASYVPPPVV